MIKYLLEALFPPICGVCGNKINDAKYLVCNSCRVELPLTYNWLIPKNSIYKKLAEHCELEAAISLFYYNIENKYTNLIINAKFKNQRKLAILLGEWMGEVFISLPEIKNIDYIIAVPLHKSRLRWRGYNQSYLIAKGLSKTLDIPLLDKVVVRHKKSQVQSKIRSNEARKKNVEKVFSINNSKILKNKRILLVDDVITTGATISSCINTINEKAPSCKIIACATTSINSSSNNMAY